jgi:hypothetical protein
LQAIPAPITTTNIIIEIKMIVTITIITIKIISDSEASRNKYASSRLRRFHRPEDMKESESNGPADSLFLPALFLYFLQQTMLQEIKKICFIPPRLQPLWTRDLLLHTGNNDSTNRNSNENNSKKA